MVHKATYSKLLILIAAVVATMAAGCSSSSSSSTGSQTSSSPAALSGADVKIMVIATRSNPILSQPELFAAAQARADEINANGGVNGHKLVIDACDANLDPNQEQACLNQAASNHVSAVVSSSLLFSPLGALQKVGIPLIGSQGVDINELSSSIAYPFAGSAVEFPAEVRMAKADGDRTIAISSLQTSAADWADQLMVATAKKLGIKITGNVSSPASTTDWAAAAATVTNGNPDAVLTVGSSGTLPQIAEALRQSGYQGKIYAFASEFNSAGLKALGTTGNGIRVACLATPLSDTSNPEVKEFLADMQKYAPSAVLSQNAELGWSGVYLFGELMKNATAFTGQDVMAAADQVKTPIQGGTFGPFIGSGTSPVPTYPRLLNTDYLPCTVRNGQLNAAGQFTSAY